jgi:orotate phosphoribosyltransferase-like protein
MIQKKNEEVVIVRWEKLGESESRLEAINVSLMNGKSSSVSSLPIRIKSNLLTSVI